MTSTPLIDVTEVTGLVNSGGELPPQAPSSSQLEPMSLSEVHAEVGNFFVPGYLPDGFTLFRTVALGQSSAILAYQGDGLKITLKQGLGQIHDEVGVGAAEATTVGGEPGFVVRGGWTQHVKNGRLAPAAWDPNIAILLLFQKQGKWCSVGAAPNPDDSGLGEADLRLVAESFTVFSG